jgi:hypothetical protein
MGSGASTTSSYASQQLVKHCPHIKHELDDIFYKQAGSNMYPVYNLKIVNNLDDYMCDYNPTMYWVDRPFTRTNESTHFRHKKIRKLNEEYTRAWEYFEWYFSEPHYVRNELAKYIGNGRTIF